MPGVKLFYPENTAKSTTPEKVLTKFSSCGYKRRGKMRSGIFTGPEEVNI